jgi:hypothetical protein
MSAYRTRLEDEGQSFKLSHDHVFKGNGAAWALTTTLQQCYSHVYQEQVKTARSLSMPEYARRLNEATEDMSHAHVLILCSFGGFVYPARKMAQPNKRLSAGAAASAIPVPNFTSQYFTASDTTHNASIEQQVAVVRPLSRKDAQANHHLDSSVVAKPVCPRASPVASFPHLLQFFKDEGLRIEHYGTHSALSCVRTWARSKKEGPLFLRWCQHLFPMGLEAIYRDILNSGSLTRKDNWVVATAHIAKFAFTVWHRVLATGRITDFNSTPKLVQFYKNSDHGFAVDFTVMPLPQRMQYLEASLVYLNFWCTNCVGGYRGGITGIYCTKCQQTAGRPEAVNRYSAYVVQQAERKEFIASRTAGGKVTYSTAGKLFLEHLVSLGQTLLQAPPKAEAPADTFLSLAAITLDQSLIPMPPMPSPLVVATAGDC